MSSYDVQVKLSTVGATELSASLRSVSTSAGAADVSVTNLYSSLMKFTAVKFVFNEAASALMAFAKSGFEFNKQMESAQLGIQATLLTFRTYKDTANAGANSSREAANALTLLQSEAFRTTGTMSQLVEGFQRLQAGASASKATTADIVRLTGTIANFAQASGQSFNTLSSQVNLALMGVSRSTGAFGAFLRSMHVTPEVLRSWQQAGTSVENVTKLLQKYVDMGPEINKTLAGVMSNVQDVIQQASGTMMKPLTDALKDAGTEFVDSMTQTFNKGTKDQFTTLSEQVKAELRVWGEILRMAFQAGIDGAKTLFAVLSDGKSSMDIFKEIATWTAGIKRDVEEIVRGLVLMTRMSQLPAQAAAGALAVGSGQFDFAKERAESIKKWAKDAYDYVDGRQERMKARDEAYLKDLERIEAASRVIDSHSIRIIEDTGKPGAPPVDEKALAALEKLKAGWNAFVETLRSKIDVQALTGLNQQLAAVDAWVIKEDNAVLDMVQKFKAGSKERIAAEQVAMDLIVGIQASADAKKEALRQTDIERHARDLQTITAAERTSAEDRVAAEAAAQIKSIQIVIDHGRLTVEEAKRASQAILDIEQTRDLKIDKIRAERLGDWGTYYNDLVALAVLGGKGMVEAMQESLDDTAKHAYANAVTFAEGWKAGLLQVGASLKTFGQNVADTMTSIWSAMGTAFEDSFYDIISGKISSLGDVLKGLWDSIEKSFAKMLSNMLQNWLMTGSIMGNGVGQEGSGGLLGGLLNSGGGGSTIPMSRTLGQNGGYAAEPTGGGGGAMGQAGGYLALAGAAYYAGSTIINAAGKNQQQYTMAGQTQTGDFGGNAKFGDFIGPAAAAVIGTYLAIAVGVGIIPVVGWIAAALILVVGAVLAIINGPKEASAKLNLSQMGDGTPLGQAMLQSYGQTYGQMAGINKAGGGSSKDFAAYMAANMEGTKSWQPWIHAGSGDDMTKDADQFFKVVLPRINMSQAFGRTWTGAYHNTVTDAGYAGIEGAPVYAKGATDPNAPIVQMLAGLGLTAKAIGNIADQIDIRDPQDFVKYLGAIVDALVSFKGNVKNLSKTWIDIQKDMSDAQKAGATGSLKAVGQNVVDLAAELSNYVGDEALTKAGELNKAADDYYQTSLKAVMALIDAMHQVDDDAKSFKDKLAQVFKNPDWLAADRTGRMASGGWLESQLSGADSIAQVQAIWKDFMTDAAAQEQYLLDIINQANAGMTAAQELATKFTSIMTDASKATTVYTLWEDALGLQAKYAHALTLSGKEQLNALDEVNAAAGALYSSLLQIIQGINQAEGDIHKSIANQIWENNYSAAGNDTTRRDMINAQLTGLMGGIGNLNTAGDISSSASEAQGLISRYLSMFSQNDPGRAQAVKEANQALADLDRLTHQRLEELKAQAQKDADAAAKVLSTTADAFHDASVRAKDDLNSLSDAVERFSGLVDTKLMGWATDITDEMDKAAKALVDAMTRFTKSLEGEDTGAGGGGGHHGPDEAIGDLTISAGDGADALGKFTTALKHATGALTGEGAP